MDWLIASNVIVWVLAGAMCAAHVNDATGSHMSCLEIVGLIVFGPFLILAGIIYGLGRAGKFWYFVFKAWMRRRKHGIN